LTSHPATAISARKEEHGVPIGGEFNAAVARLADSELLRLATCNGLQPPFRGFRVLVEIYGRYRVGKPFAIGRNGRLAQPFHLHHVLKGHGVFGWCGLCRAKQ
jgi:hypothetical protein